MKRLALLFSGSLILCMPAPAPAAEADPVQAAMAKVFAGRQESAVTLAVTRKVKGKDHSFEVAAVAVDGKGLLATSLSGIEAGDAGGLGKLMISAGEEEGEEGGARPEEDKGELTRVAWLRVDATEAEADLVVTDAALDLALVQVRPVTGEGAALPPAPPVAKEAPALLDNVLIIERQGPELQRVASAALTQVAALVTTPRRFLLLAAPATGGTGVFNAAGEWLGVAATVRNQDVVVPAEAVLKLAASTAAKKGG